MQTFYIILLIWALLAVTTFFVLFFISAPYGRHYKKGFGPSINGTAGWIAMEAPAVIIFALMYTTGYCLDIYSIALLFMWELHYVHRTLIYPLRRRNTLKPMPILIVLFGMIFNGINGLLNGYWIYHLEDGCSGKWVPALFFLVGTAVFITGFIINLTADEKLLKLRRQRGVEYQIPQGGLYRYVTCPNYFGEIVEWIGFAIASLSPAALVFALWTCANLVPRALSHRAWYRAHFPNYPKDRKAIFPFLL